MISDFDNKGYVFDRIARAKIITLANKMGMTYDFNNKHNKHAVESKLFSMINKDNILLNKLDRRWNHPLIRKNSHVLLNNY